MSSGGEEAASGAISRLQARGRNPIFNRELLTLLRSRKAFLLLAVYAVLTVGIVLASWPQEAAEALLQGQISRELFRLFGTAQLLLLVLLVPPTLAGAMTHEKEGETLDLLLTTPITGNQILVGKLLSGLCFLLLLIAVSTPALLLCFLIGGLSGGDIAGLYVYLGAMALLFGQISLTCSVYFHRTHNAMIVSYLLIGPLAFGGAAVYGDGIGFLRSPDTPILLGLAGVLGGALYAIAHRRVRRPFHAVRKAMDEEDVSRQLGLIIHRDRFPDRLIAPPRRKTSLPDRKNPVLDKELQAEIYGSGSLFVRLVIQFGMLASFGAFLWVLSAALRPEAALHAEYPYFCFLIAYVLIVGPSLATATFTQEKEFHTIEALTLTLIPRPAIVAGKFLAILRVVGALTLLNTTCFLIAVLLSSHNFHQIPLLLLAAGGAAVFSVTLGMFLSLRCRTTTAATISTYSLLFALFVGPMLLKTFLTQFFPSFPVATLSWLDLASPFLASHQRGPVGDQVYRLGLHTLVVLAVSALMLYWMARRFERTLRTQFEKV